MIDHLNAYALAVQDVRTCAEFYEKKIGLELKELQDDFAYLTFPDMAKPGVALVSQKGVGEELSEGQVRPGERMACRGYFAVFVDDADRLYKELKAKGVHFVKAPTTRPHGQRYAYFEDPEGNLWEISHFPKK
ncbi:MAG TPA: VOC family protein [Thermoplasmata archaeon]|nr:VOC family protein [Thermoplasmata archaeon]